VEKEFFKLFKTNVTFREAFYKDKKEKERK